MGTQKTGKWTTEDVLRDMGWNFSQLEAATMLGLPAARMRLRDRSLFDSTAEWVREESHIREWVRTFDALAPRRFPKGSFMSLAAAGVGAGVVARAAVLEAFGWNLEQLQQASTALRLPRTFPRVVARRDEEGVQRIAHFYFVHELDSWTDAVRMLIRATGVEVGR